MDKIYDILVVGGGPAGVTSAIYAKRAGRDVAIIEKFVIGGQLSLIGEIENYPGFSSIAGDELAKDFRNHAKSLDIPFIYDDISDFDLAGDVKTVASKKQSYKAKAVILAMGSHPKELNIDGEKNFIGRGVSYCALCDGNFFKNQDVAVVGSGDSAVSDALYLSNICKNVYVLTKNQLKLNNYSEDDLSERENIKVLKGAISKQIEGDNKVQTLVYEKDGEESNLDVNAVFVAIGRKPDTDNLKDKINLNDRGFIETNDRMETSTKGVYACGDVRTSVIKQIATAVGDGAIAGNEASKYVLIMDKLNKK
mgnify:FL=1